MHLRQRLHWVRSGVKWVARKESSDALGKAMMDKMFRDDSMAQTLRSTKASERK